MSDELTENVDLLYADAAFIVTVDADWWINVEWGGRGFSFKAGGITAEDADKIAAAFTAAAAYVRPPLADQRASSPDGEVR